MGSERLRIKYRKAVEKYKDIENKFYLNSPLNDDGDALKRARAGGRPEPGHYA
jgi:hypothetical protein